MIIDGMTAQEIHAEIRRDENKVLFKLRSLEGKARKAFSRERLFPKIFHEIHTVSFSQNRYLLWYAANGDNDERTMCFSGYACLIPNGHGAFSYGRIRQANDSFDGLFNEDALYLYDYHFVDRYRERILGNKQMNIHAAAALLFKRNPVFIIVVMRREYNIRHKDYDSEIAVSIPDGLCFVTCGHVADNGGKAVEPKLALLFFNTILSRSMMKPQQRDREIDDVMEFMGNGSRLGYFDAETAGLLARMWTGSRFRHVWAAEKKLQSHIILEDIEKWKRKNLKT